MTVRAIAPMLLNAGLSKTAGCRKKSPPTCYYWPATLLGISLWMAFLNKISLDWPLTLTTQLSTSKLSDNPANGFFMIYWSQNIATLYSLMSEPLYIVHVLVG